MKYREFLELIEKQMGIKPSHAKISFLLGGKPSANALSNRYFNDGNLKYEEMLILEQAFKINSQLDKNSTNTIRDMVEIQYWDEVPEVSYKVRNPLVTSLWLDRELITNIWKRDIKNLRIISMPGDKMDGGDYPLRTGDILLIDISKRDITESGIFFFSTNNNQNLFVNTINVRLDGSVAMTFNNKKYEQKTPTMQQLKDIDFKVIGRMVKNLSLIK